MSSRQARPKANIFVDGFNLYYGALKGTPYKWLDLDALFCRLLPSYEIHRIRYFMARISPGQGTPMDRRDRTHTFVRWPRCRASQLIIDAMRGDCDLAVVVSNDSDLCEPIRIVKDELGVPVGLLNPHRHPSGALKKFSPTFVRPIRSGPLSASQFPAKVITRSGPVSKPASW